MSSQVNARCENCSWYVDGYCTHSIVKELDIVDGDKMKVDPMEFCELFKSRVD